MILSLHGPDLVYLHLRVLCLVVASGVCLFCATRPGEAADASPSAALTEEIRLTHKWVEAAFARPSAAGAHDIASAPTDVMEVREASHKVLKNRTVWSGPLRLDDRTFAHGLYMDAPARVHIRLSRPAAELTAQVGIDNNPSTRSKPEAGSARFHVLVDGERVFSTPVLRLRDKPVAVRVPLHGATEFDLEVDDGGNGRGWDQCTWADAAVTFENGVTRYLDERPLAPFRRTQRTTAPFSFTYGGKSSETLLPTWNYSTQSVPAEHGARRIIRYKCPQTGLMLACEVATYDDSPAVDWVFHLTNEGKSDTPIIENFLPLDAALVEAAPAEPITLRWSNGDDHAPDAFLPHDEPLKPSVIRQFTPTGGRSSNGASGGAFPFFNLLGPDGGWVLAVGWSGQWCAEFARESDGSLTVGAGMATTHFRLHPGERVRTPRIVLLRYRGDEMIRGHNLFRRLMLRHYAPRSDGRPAIPPVCHNTAATIYRSKQRATEQNQRAIIRKAAELGCEAYWMDAYWYPQPWHLNVGNWHPRPEDFPHGLRPLADAAHALGMKFVLWFEPERVAPGTQFDRERSACLLKLTDDGPRLFNLGDPAARRFLTDFLDRRIKEWKVDVYRNDFNLDPLPFWRKHDAPTRQGVTEMRYIEGLYAMWSELRRRNPGLTIDNCASGGRRIDVETCSLSYPLWRSDLNDIGEGLKGESHWPLMARADQVHVTGLALYIPFQSGPLWDMHPYSFRSAMTSSVVLYEQILPDDFPAELAKQGIAELKRLRPLFLGDLYPLLPLTTSQADWYAYQLHRSDLGAGCVFVFRRPESPDVARRIHLREIDDEVVYGVRLTGETYDAAPVKTMTGKELQDLTVRIEAKPGSVLLEYRRR